MISAFVSRKLHISKCEIYNFLNVTLHKSTSVTRNVTLSDSTIVTSSVTRVSYVEVLSALHPATSVTGEDMMVTEYWEDG